MKSSLNTARLGNKRWISFFLSAQLCLLLFAPQAYAATIDLDFQTGFSNGTTVINVGDTIRWTWTDGSPHSVISLDDGFPSSEVLFGLGTTYEVTFTTVGDFDYICGVHGPSMGGTISVIESAAVPLLSPPMLIGLSGVLAGAGMLWMRRRSGAAESA